MILKVRQAFTYFFSVLPVCVLLSACTTLGPDYHEPEVPWLERWDSDLYGQVGSCDDASQVDLRFWWHLFDDSVLNRLIELARQENPSIKIAGLRILESRAALGIATGSRYPQVQQAVGAVDYVNTRFHGGGGGDGSQDLVGYQAGLNLGWELDFWGKFRRGVESADAAFFASVHNQHHAQVLLSAQVTDLYFAYRTALLRIAIARKNMAVQKRSYEITERRYTIGQESELDLQQAKTQYLATLSTIPALEITLAKVRNALCVLLGRPPGPLPELPEEARPLPVIDRVVLREIPARLLMRRPDIRAAALQVAVRSSQIGIAQADLYPSITLLGSLGWTGNSLAGTGETVALSIGPSFTWNLFNYGRIKNNVRVQDARLQQTIENFQNSVLQAALEMDNAAVDVVKTREQKAVLRESVQAAERSLALANVRYSEGYADFQRVLDAQRAQAVQAEREVINDGNHISAVINFYKTLGGGWLDMPIGQLLPEPRRTTMESRSDWGDMLRAPLPDAARNLPWEADAEAEQK